MKKSYCLSDFEVSIILMVESPANCLFVTTHNLHIDFYSGKKYLHIKDWLQDRELDPHVTSPNLFVNKVIIRNKLFAPNFKNSILDNSSSFAHLIDESTKTTLSLLNSNNSWKEYISTLSKLGLQVPSIIFDDFSYLTQNQSHSPLWKKLFKDSLHPITLIE